MDVLTGGRPRRDAGPPAPGAGRPRRDAGADGQAAEQSPPGRGAADVCEVFCFDAAKVERLKAEVAQTRGLALLFKAFADDTRVKIIYALSREELCVCDVASIIGTSVATASHHLRFLRNLGLARYRKEGKLVFYRLDDHHVERIIANALAHFQEGTR